MKFKQCHSVFKSHDQLDCFGDFGFWSVSVGGEWQLRGPVYKKSKSNVTYYLKIAHELSI